jgi:hypothetical protein
MLDVARNMIATWWQHGGGGRRSADFLMLHATWLAMDRNMLATLLVRLYNLAADSRAS